MTSPDANLGSFVDAFIRDYLALPENNHLGPGSEGKAGRRPGRLLQRRRPPVPGPQGARGALPLDSLEAFALAEAARATEAKAPVVRRPRRTATAVAAEDLTVVSWALCQSDEAKKTNSRETRYPSEAWARARMFGQECNNALHVALVAALRDAGYAAVAPALLPEWSQLPSERYFMASTWSERHVAHVSGLGTFGLAGGLITEKGQAVRLGSVVVQARIPATSRAYSGPFDYCLFLTRGICARCVARCPWARSKKRAGTRNPAVAIWDRPCASTWRAISASRDTPAVCARRGCPASHESPARRTSRTDTSGAGGRLCRQAGARTRSPSASLLPRRRQRMADLHRQRRGDPPRQRRRRHPPRRLPRCDRQARGTVGPRRHLPERRDVVRPVCPRARPMDRPRLQPCPTARPPTSLRADSFSAETHARAGTCVRAGAAPDSDSSTATANPRRLRHRIKRHPTARSAAPRRALPVSVPRYWPPSGRR